MSGRSFASVAAAVHFRSDMKEFGLTKSIRVGEGRKGRERERPGWEQKLILTQKLLIVSNFFPILAQRCS